MLEVRAAGAQLHRAHAHETGADACAGAGEHVMRHLALMHEEVCVHICMCVYKIYIYVCMYVYTYPFACPRVYMHVLMYIYLYICREASCSDA